MIVGQSLYVLTTGKNEGIETCTIWETDLTREYGTENRLRVNTGCLEFTTRYVR